MRFFFSAEEKESMVEFVIMLASFFFYCRFPNNLLWKTRQTIFTNSDKNNH